MRRFFEKLQAERKKDSTGIFSDHPIRIIAWSV